MSATAAARAAAARPSRAPRPPGPGTLLAAVVLAAALLLTAKLGDLLRALPAGVPVARAEAQEAAADAAAPATPAPEEAAARPEATGQDATPDAAAPPLDPATLSPGEIELLQRLRERRAELEERERRLELREAVLETAGTRLGAQIERLEALRADIQAELERRAAEADERLQSLIKIYEKMKPKDAAAIFDCLEMPVLVAVAGGMREAKAAPIIAAMDRDKAERLTRRLAERQHPLTPPG